MKHKKFGCLTAGIFGYSLLVFGVISGSRFASEIRAARERLAEMDSQYAFWAMKT